MTEESQSNGTCPVMWQRRLGQALAHTPLPLGAGILVLTSLGQIATLRSLNVRDGSEDWSASFEASPCLNLLRTNRRILYVGSDTLTIVDASLGQVTQHIRCPQGHSYTGAGLSKKGFAYLVSKTEQRALIQAVNVTTGEIVWETELPDETSAEASLINASGQLICVSQGQETISLYAFDRTTGKQSWHRHDIEGKAAGYWSGFNLVDLVVQEKGVWGLNSADGTDRSLRFFGMQYVDARIVGQSFLTVTDVDGLRELLCFDTVTSELKGKVPTDVERVLGAHPSEVLTEHPDGYPELFSLPKLDPIVLPDAKEIGRTREVVWARDVAYLIARDGRTITALDLRDV